MYLKNIKEFYKKHNFLIRILAIVLPINVLFFGCIFWKNLFWNNFLWKYYWGPVVSDAENRIIDGITPGYNVVSTITYGIILVLSLFLIYKIFIKLSLKIDGKFFVSISPFIILGPALRVMEDAGFFDKPFVYLFISPFIYIFLGILVFLLVIIGYYVDKIRKTKIMNYVVFIPGFSALCISAYLLSSVNWKYPNAVMFILCTTLVASIASFFILFLLEKKYEKLSVYLLGSNVLLFFAHFLDASATFVGTDFYNYAEKHPLPAFLINLSGTGAVMYPLKFILIFLVIYVLDITYKKEIKDKTLAGLIKICIFILGLAPGVRDMLRIGIGV
jgi:uncharacterized membrane protein